MQDIDETSADVPPPTPLLSIDEIIQELLGALKFETRAPNAATVKILGPQIEESMRRFLYMEQGGLTGDLIAEKKSPTLMRFCDRWGVTSCGSGVTRRRDTWTLVARGQRS